MAHWLFKSEPDSWSWDQQKAKGAAGQEWDGVRNYQARNFMRAMKRGERGFFYHSNEGKAVVGVVEVAAEAHRDSTSEDPAWECVDLRALADLPRPVTLDEIKREPSCRDMVLVRNSRLSVQPVTEDEFRAVCRMGGLDPSSLG
jgi:predicted RNA-binding protein with PUA-like domain